MENLQELLTKGTMAGVIKWTPNGTEVRTTIFGPIKGYKTTVDGFTVETIVKQTSRKLLLHTEEYWESALSIEKDGKKIVFTSNPEEIEGEKENNVFITCVGIHRMMEEKDIVMSLSKEISGLLYR